MVKVRLTIIPGGQNDSIHINLEEKEGCSNVQSLFIILEHYVPTSINTPDNNF